MEPTQTTRGSSLGGGTNALELRSLLLFGTINDKTMKPIVLMFISMAFLTLSCANDRRAATSGNPSSIGSESSKNSGSPSADDRVLERQIRNAFLTLSAFECAIVAPNGQESQRLFNIGLKAGREFHTYSQSNRDRLETAIKSKVQFPLEWYLFTRDAELPFDPGADFILGRLFAGQVQGVNSKRTGPNEEVIKAQGDEIYRDKNCALITSN